MSGLGEERMGEAEGAPEVETEVATEAATALGSAVVAAESEEIGLETPW